MDENSQQVFQQLSDEIRALNETVALNSQVRMTAMKPEEIERMNLSNTFGRNSKAVGENTAAVDTSSRAYKENLKAAQEYEQAMKNFAESLKTGAEGLGKVFNKLISQDPSRSFAKYNDGLSTLGSAVSKAAENFGPLGKALGVTIQGLTKVGSIYAEQADALLKANDNIAKFGTAGAFTTKELLDMANKAGVTSKNMDVLVKPIQSLGPALTNLGRNTGEGVKAFADLTKISNQQREQYQRMGVSQEELIQNQADYIQLQRVSGRTISMEAKDRDALRKASLEYTDNLNQLAALSGQDAATLKKKQQEANSAAELQIKNMMMADKATRLRAAGDEEGAKKIEKELDMRKKLLDAAIATGDEQTKQAVTARLATGTWTEQSKSLALMGIRMEDFEKKMKEGKDVSGEFLNALAEGGKRQVRNFGEAAVFSDELRKTTGLNKDFMTFLNSSKGKDYELEQKKIAQQQAAAKEAGKDPAQDFRAKMTTTEIEVGKAFDGIVDSANILTGGFTLQTVALTAFGVALVGATGALMKQAGTGLLSKGAGVVKDAIAGKGLASAVPVATTVAQAAAPAAATAAAPVAATAATATGAAATGATGAAGAATTAATALSKLAGPLTSLSRAAPLIGTVMSIGTGVVDAYQGIKKADKDLQEGKITKEQARVEKGEAVGGGVGTAAGGSGGALAGAAAGAAIGSVVPVVGTAIGGIIGAALGGWLGSKGGKAIGEVAGGSIAKMTADADKKVDESVKKNAQKAEDKKEKELTKDSSKDKQTEAIPVIVKKIDDPAALKALSGMSLGTDFKSALPAGMLNATALSSDILEKSQATFKNKALPKAAVGGVFEGPKSGYPVELHGKEMITPLGSGTKTSALPDEDDEEELEKEREAIKELKDTIQDTDVIFKKLTSSIVKLDDIQKDKLEQEEESANTMESVQDKLKNVFSNAALDLSKFSSKIKVVTQEAPSSGTGVKVPDNIGGILGGSAGGGKTSESGQGLKPPSAPPLAGMGGGTGVTAPPVKQDVKQNLSEVKAALMKRGMTDEKYLNSVLGNVMKESGGKIQNEKLDYSRTSNERIRSIFGSRAAGKTDAELNQIKSSEEGMGEFMYGKDTKIGRSMGNLEPGDGFKYRGRGYIQLTGKNNYAQASQAVFGDDRLVKDPDLMNEPKVAAEVVAWYMEKGKSRMATAMGIDEKNMTQEQANLLATSQIAGGDVRKKGSYLSGEVMQKVTAYAGSKEIQGIEPASGGVMVATAKSKKDEIPKAQGGGVFEGPDSGYMVELHGNETVIPNDQIKSVAKSPIKLFSEEMGPTFAGMNEYTGYNQGPMSTDLTAISKMASKIGAFDDKTQTITDPEAWKKIVGSGIGTNYNLAGAEMGTKSFDTDVGDLLGDRLKELMENNNGDLSTAMEKLSAEFKDAMLQLKDVLAKQTADHIATLNGPAEENPMSEMVDLLSTIADKLSESHDTQEKLLQNSRV